MLAQLIPVDGGSPVELKNDTTLVGRKSGVCDLVLERGSVSKLHCLVVKTDGLLFIRDLGSTNGTKVNGQKVTRGALLPGDELAFASVKFRVHLGPSNAPPVEDHMRTEMLTPVHSELNPPENGSANSPGDPEAGESESDVRLVNDESAV